jgi:ADP-ribosyltransferase exoenzyme
VRSAMGSIKGAGKSISVGSTGYQRLDKGMKIIDRIQDSLGRPAGSVASRGAGDLGGSVRSSAGPVASRNADEVAGAAQESGEAALTKYLGGGAHDLNSYLRGARAGTDEVLEAKAKAISSHLNSLPPVDGQIRTFRGVIGDFTKDLKRGDIFVDKAFMSTSKDKNVVDEFIASGGQLNGKNTEGVGTRFVIDSEGTGRDVDKFTGLSEREVLFDRNTPFEITGMSTTGNKMRVNGEVIDVKTIYMKTPGLETD